MKAAASEAIERLVVARGTSTRKPWSGERGESAPITQTTYDCPVCGDRVTTGQGHIGSVFCRLRAGASFVIRVAQVTEEFQEELDALEAACRLSGGGDD